MGKSAGGPALCSVRTGLACLSGIRVNFRISAEPKQRKIINRLMNTYTLKFGNNEIVDGLVIVKKCELELARGKKNSKQGERARKPEKQNQKSKAKPKKQRAKSKTKRARQKGASEVKRARGKEASTGWDAL